MDRSDWKTRWPVLACNPGDTARENGLWGTLDRPTAGRLFEQLIIYEWRAGRSARAVLQLDTGQRTDEKQQWYNGAQRMTHAWIPLQRPSIGRAEQQAVARVVALGRIGGNGPIGQAVERALARRLRVKHALLMTSCTHAFQAALRALEIGRGDEVILPAYAYVSMANAILNVGARPVFIDVEPARMTIDPHAAQRAITRRTKAILAVHYAGYPCDLHTLRQLTRQYKIALIEDAAQAIGSTYRGRALGTIGDVGCLSFHATKNLTCGEGGAILTHSTALAKRLDIIREKGTNRSAFLRGRVRCYAWIMPGDNYVLSELQAAILRAQLPQLARITAAHRRWGRRYLRALQPLAARGVIRLPQFDTAVRHNWHLFYVHVRPPWRRENIIAHLRRRRIQSTFHFVALHRAPFGRQLYRGPSLPHAEAAERRLLRLPLFARMRQAEHARVVDALHEAFASRRRR